MNKSPHAKRPDASRRRKGLDLFCLYCGGSANSRDHVPPKVLVEEPYPPNYRTVPACVACNRSWSLDEEYLAIVLAHIGDLPHLTAKIEDGGKFDRALRISTKLDDRIIDSLFVDNDGNVRFQPEASRIAAVVEKVAFGLHALKYGRGPKPSDFTCVTVVGRGGALSSELRSALWVWPGARAKRWTNVQDGVFRFLFAKSWVAKAAPLYCFIELHRTLLVVAACPPAVGRPKARLASPPW